MQKRAVYVRRGLSIILSATVLASLGSGPVGTVTLSGSLRPTTLEPQRVAQEVRPPDVRCARDLPTKWQIGLTVTLKLRQTVGKIYLLGGRAQTQASPLTKTKNC